MHPFPNLGAQVDLDREHRRAGGRRSIPGAKCSPGSLPEQHPSNCLSLGSAAIRCKGGAHARQDQSLPEHAQVASPVPPCLAHAAAPTLRLVGERADAKQTQSAVQEVLLGLGWVRVHFSIIPRPRSVPIAGRAQLPYHVGQHAVAQRGVRVEQYQLAPRELAAQSRRLLEVPAGVVVPALQTSQQPALHETLAGGATPTAAQRHCTLQVLQGTCGSTGRWRGSAKCGIRAPAHPPNCPTPPFTTRLRVADF